MKRYRISVVIEKDADGYFAFCPELQGCYTQGDSYEEVLENIRDAVHLHIEDRVADMEDIPHTEAISLTSLEVADERKTPSDHCWQSDQSSGEDGFCSCPAERESQNLQKNSGGRRVTVTISLKKGSSSKGL